MAPLGIQYRTTSYNTITTATIFRALHARGGEVYTWVYETCELIAKEGERIAPVNNVLNALHRGGVVGTYKRAFVAPTSTRGGNQHVTMLSVQNLARHAFIVEYGRPYVRRRQVFTWEHARRLNPTTGDVRQAQDIVAAARRAGKNLSMEDLFRVSTKQTHRRAGYHTLEQATKNVLRRRDTYRTTRMPRGFTRSPF